MDQAAHNVMLHYLHPAGTLSYTAIGLPNGQSPVYNLLYGFPVVIDTLGVVKVVRGSSVFVPEVVHQVDRSSGLWAALSKLYQCVDKPGVYSMDTSVSGTGWMTGAHKKAKVGGGADG